MKKKFQNGFFLFGIVVLAIMVTQLNFSEVWKGLQHAGYWFFAVLLLWAFLYIFNTASWYIIIKSQTKGEDKRMVSFGYLYKLSVSGIVAIYWSRTCHIVGAFVCNDTHIQPFLVLVTIYSSLYTNTTR